MHRRAPATALALCCSLALAGGACAAGAASSSNSTGGQTSSTDASAARRAPARDSFSGRIVSGGGRYRHSRGAASVYLHFHGRQGFGRAATASIAGSRCGQPAHGCLNLSGTLTGTLVPGPRALPDTGQSYTFKGSGRVRPLGEANGHGTIHGTGFIANGREQMRITMKTAGGTITITAQSKPVPGFTSP